MAKTFSDLYPQITSFDNLYFAFKRAAKGKRSQPEVATFEFDLESQLFQLQSELEDKSYQPGPYYSFYIHDPKVRLVSAAPFRDRVIHHALCGVIEPLFERTFIGDSYANRVGKGTHKAIDRAQKFSRRYAYVVQCDIRQFFPSVDHQILRAILAKKLHDGDTLWLIDQILDNGADVLADEYTMVYYPDDDMLAACRPRGLPIGNLTSQFWANVYMNELDQFVKRELRCPAFCRYVDDFLLFSNSKAELWQWKSAIRDLLTDLRLSLHERSSTVYPVTNGIPFLGFRIYPTHIRLKRRNGVAFAKRLRKWQAMVARGEMTLEQLSERIRGWVAHAAHGDTWGLRRALLSDNLL